MALHQSAAEVEIPQWTLGDRLRKARDHAAMTREDMAKAMGVTPGAISHWECDRQRPRKVDEAVAQWAAITGVSMSWLMWGLTTHGYNPDGTPDDDPSQWRSGYSRLTLVPG